jgi:hypothetical protein
MISPEPTLTASSLLRCAGSPLKGRKMNKTTILVAGIVLTFLLVGVVAFIVLQNPI